MAADCGCWLTLTHTWFHLPCILHPSSPSIIRLGGSQEKYICEVPFLSVVPKGGSSGSNDLLVGFTSPLPHLITNCWEQVYTKCLIDIKFMHFQHSVWLWWAADLSRNRVVVKRITRGKRDTFVYFMLQWLTWVLFEFFLVYSEYFCNFRDQGTFSK